MRALITLLLLLAGWPPPLPAVVTGYAAGEGYEMKAAFLYNFAKFVEWPSTVLPADLDTFLFCVHGDPRMQQVADRMLQDKQVQGRSVVVRLVRPSEDLSHCHVLYLDGVSGEQVERVGSLVKTLPVLTVGEADRFIQWGGIIKLFVEEGRLRFEVSPQAAARAQLKISSKLLKLGRIIDTPSGER